MNPQQPESPITDAPEEPKNRVAGGLVLQPVSDMSEYEAKPKPEVVPEPENKATFLPPIQPEDQRDVQLPYQRREANKPVDRRRVASRVPSIAFYIAIPFITLAGLLLYRMISGGLAVSEWPGYVGYIFPPFIYGIIYAFQTNPIWSLQMFGPAILLLLLSACLLVTRSIKAARVITSVLLVIQFFAMTYLGFIIYSFSHFRSGVFQDPIILTLIISSFLMLAVLFSSRKAIGQLDEYS